MPSSPNGCYDLIFPSLYYLSFYSVEVLVVVVEDLVHRHLKYVVYSSLKHLKKYLTPCVMSNNLRTLPSVANRGSFIILVRSHQKIKGVRGGFFILTVSVLPTGWIPLDPPYQLHPSPSQCKISSYGTIISNRPIVFQKSSVRIL